MELEAELVLEQSLRLEEKLGCSSSWAWARQGSKDPGPLGRDETLDPPPRPRRKRAPFLTFGIQ